MDASSPENTKQHSILNPGSKSEEAAASGCNHHVRTEVCARIFFAAHGCLSKVLESDVM